MGTQQLLLIVLGVIIVGVAIAVGITIFNNQAFNSNRQAVATELNTYGNAAMQWWKTPKSQGGAGKDFTGATASTIAEFIGFDEESETLTTDTGQFKVTGAATADKVIIEGIGTEKKGTNYPHVKATVDLVEGKITSVVSGTSTGSFGGGDGDTGGDD